MEQKNEFVCEWKQESIPSLNYLKTLRYQDQQP